MLDIKGCIVTSDAMGCQILFNVFPSDDTEAVCQ